MATEPKHVRELRQRLAREHIDITEVEYTGGTHLRLHVSKNGVKAHIIHSLSPSARLSQTYAVSNARRALREAASHA